jgi:hypothetical protein
VAIGGSGGFSFGCCSLAPLDGSGATATA